MGLLAVCRSLKVETKEAQAVSASNVVDYLEFHPAIA